MEIPPQLQSLLSKTATTATRDTAASATSVGKLLDINALKAGIQLQAQVAAVKALNTQERATLLDLLQQNGPAGKTPTQNLNSTTASGASSSATLPPTNSNATTSQGMPLGTSESSSMQQLLAKPELYLIRLQLQGKQLSTISSVLLQTKQLVDISKREDGQLQLHPRATQPASSNSVMTSGYVKHAPTSLEQKSAASVSAQNTAQPNTPSNASLRDKLLANFTQQQLINTLTAGLRQYMPQEKVLADTFKQLDTLQKSLHQPNTMTGNTATTTTPTIAALLNKAMETTTGLSPEVLQRSIARSGLSLEGRLRAAANQIKQQNSTASTNRSPDSTFNKAIATESHTLISTAGKVKTNSSTADTLQALREHAVPYDLKTSLLRILNSASTIRIPTQQQTSFFNHIQTLLPSLTPQEIANLPKLELEQRMNNAVRQWVMSGIARITSMQLRHLLSSIQDTSVTGAGGIYELPIKLGETFYPVVLHIQERYQREKEDEPDSADANRNKKPTLRSSWHVYLEFDLDEYGIFASDITLIDKSIKTQFWIQQGPLWHKSKHHLNELRSTLEQAGIKVDEMLCSQGNPPDKSINLQHALVDIRT
ncbi:hypothetical protein TDB9533_01169 [Thalassocella blandensis]|nr:hypothetical protein TDB9533_01169 [Thalassocella blandensis]